MNRRLLLVVGAIGMTLCCQAGLAEGELEAGIKCYQKKDLKVSLAHFQKVLKTAPSDYNALYYTALIYHRTGAAEQAKQAYGKLIQLYPDSDAGKNAALALSYLDPKYLNRIKPQDKRGSASAISAEEPARPQRYRAPTERGSDLDSLPNDSQVFFEPRGNAMVIDAYVNNRPVKMVFDTGAEGVVFGKNHLAELGISPPQGEATGLSFGVGDGGAQKAWSSTVSIKVGQIERRNFPIAVHEDMPTLPLLGQSFFKDFQYSIQRGQGDTGAGSIRFTKKSGALTGDSQAIPFTRHGNEVVVSVQINGKPVRMFFDTGAEQCVFSEAQIRQLGIEIPEDAQEGMSLGIAGSTRTRTFCVNRMRLGPVEKADVPVSIVDSYQMPYPLLGQTFFGDLRCEFDNQAHVLRLRR